MLLESFSAKKRTRTFARSASVNSVESKRALDGISSTSPKELIDASLELITI